MDFPQVTIFFSPSRRSPDYCVALLGASSFDSDRDFDPAYLFIDSRGRQPGKTGSRKSVFRDTDRDLAFQALQFKQLRGIHRPDMPDMMDGSVL